MLVLLKPLLVVGEQADRLQQVVDDHRLEHVELQVSPAGSEGDGGIVAENPQASMERGLRIGLD